MTNKSDKSKITFKYKISPTFAMYSITGIHGGLSPQGNVIMNLFSERQAIPKEETFELLSNGSLGKNPIKTDKLDSMIRDVLFGISINPNTARSIANWLNDKADKHDKLLKQTKKKANK